MPGIKKFSHVTSFDAIIILAYMEFIMDFLIFTRRLPDGNFP